MSGNGGLAWINHAALATLTASSEASGLGVNNLATDHLAEKWRSLDAGRQSIAADLLAAQEVGVFGLFGSNLTSSARWRLRLGTALATNLMARSEDLTHSTWRKEAGGLGVVPTVTADQGLGGDGNMTAERVQLSLGGGTTGSDFSQVVQTHAQTAGDTFTVSAGLQTADGSTVTVALALTVTTKLAVTVTPVRQRLVATFGPVSSSSSTARAGILLFGGLTSPTADLLVSDFQLIKNSPNPPYIRTVAAAVTETNGDLLDTGWFSAGVAAGYGQALHVPASPLSGRYLQIDLDDTGLAAVGFMQAGALWAGPLWLPTRNFDYGAALGFVDPSPRTRTRGGQLLVDKRPTYRTDSFTLSGLEESEVYEKALELDRVAAAGGTVLWVREPGGAFQNKQAIRGSLPDLTPATHASFDVHSKPYRIEERL